MRFVRFLVLLAMQCLLIAAGLYHFFNWHPLFLRFFGRWLLPPEAPGTFDWRPSPIGLDIFWSLVLVLPAIYWVASLLAYRKRHGTINVHTSSGDTIQFQLGAIEEFVRAQVKAHPGVSSHSVQITQDRAGAISVNLGIKVKPIDSVPEIHRQVKEVLRDGIVNVLGIDNIGTINVEIKRVLGTPRRTTGPLSRPEPAPEAPIRAPFEEKPLIAHADDSHFSDRPLEETHRLEFNDEPIAPPISEPPDGEIEPVSEKKENVPL